MILGGRELTVRSTSVSARQTNGGAHCALQCSESTFQHALRCHFRAHRDCAASQGESSETLEWRHCGQGAPQGPGLCLDSPPHPQAVPEQKRVISCLLRIDCRVVCKAVPLQPWPPASLASSVAWPPCGLRRSTSVWHRRRHRHLRHHPAPPAQSTAPRGACCRPEALLSVCQTVCSKWGERVGCQ